MKLLRTSVWSLLVAFVLVGTAVVPTLADSNEDDDREERDGNKSKAGDDDRDDERHDEGDEDERKLEVSVGSEGLRITMEREAASQEDSIEMRFDFEDAEFKTKYESEHDDEETRMKLQAEFGPLLEYRDTNNNSRYDPGEPLASSYRLSQEDDADDEDGVERQGAARWGTPTVQDVTVDNQPGKKITAVAQIGSGTFELRFWVFGDFVSIENSTLKPTGVKVDVEIRDYPYAANDTALALVLTTKAKSAYEVERDHEELEDDEEGVAASTSLGGQHVQLVFAWKESAVVDGVETPVHTTTLSSKQSNETDDDGTELKRKDTFVLSYGRGGVIVHDPEAYVSIQGAQASGVPGWGLSAAFAGISVAAAAALRGRRQDE